MTIHNNAKKEDIAKVVIMPGDPLRAKWIAENFLKNYQLVNEVRGMSAYTGQYKGHTITVMGHGMGIPSIGIYSHELFAKEFYDVDAIIRVGSCGGWDENLNLGDVVVADQSISFSTYGKFIGFENQNTFNASEKLLSLVKKVNDKQAKKAVIGKVYSSDCFYGIHTSDELQKMTGGALASEMEIYALYGNAIRNKKDALGMVTVSDIRNKNQEMTPEQRQMGLTNMVTLALDTAVEYLKSKK